MHRARHLTLLSVATVLLATGLVTGLGVGAKADDGDPQDPTTPAEPTPAKVLILGDSISAKSYYGRAVNGKGWWAHLVEDTGAQLIMSVENGSGMVRRGEHCAGTTFGDRLGNLNLRRADFVVVEGGVNDLYFCTRQDRMVWAKGHKLRDRIPAFMAQLAAAADAAGLPRDHIYFFTPWGTEWLPQRPRMRAIIAAGARRIGAEYVDVPAFPRRLTQDGVHPTRKGSRFLYRKLTKTSTLLARITAAGTSPS